MSEINQGEVIPRLSPEARKESRLAANQVWKKGIELLAGKEKSAYPNALFSLEIFGEKLVKVEEANADLKIGMWIRNPKSGRIDKLESFIFHKDEGGYVLKETNYADNSRNNQHEATKYELDDLLENMESAQKIASRSTSSKRT